MYEFVKLRNLYRELKSWNRSLKKCFSNIKKQKKKTRNLGHNRMKRICKLSNQKEYFHLLIFNLLSGIGKRELQGQSNGLENGSKRT